VTDRPDGDRRDRDAIRRVLEQATRLPTPDTESLLARVPAVLAEARRRAAVPSRDDAFSAVVPVAWTVLPRLAAAAAVLVAVATGFYWFEDGATASAPASVESWILGDGDTDIDDDLVLEAVLGEGENG
jgi:hypothetical protein